MSRTKTATLQMNTLPVPTWRHLKMNGCDVRCSYQQAPFPPSSAMVSLEKEGRIQRIPALLQRVGERPRQEDQQEEQGDGNTSQSLTSFVLSNANSGYRLHFKEEEKREAPVMLDYLFDEITPTLIEKLDVVLEPESSATLIRSLTSSEAGGAFFHAGSTQVRVGREASLTLLHIRFFDEGSTDLDELDVTLDEGATFTLVEIVMGSSQSYMDTHVVMQGKRSECSIGCMNVVDRSGLADFNFHVEHKGVESNSSLLVRGALLENASKLFRGTLDFHKGCKGSKGGEDEYSVLLSPTVKNRSVPLILCGEEDVEGVHAVSSGRLDGNALFYLSSRGLDETQAKRVLVEAQMQPILAMISDEHVLSEIQRRLARRLDSHEQ